MKRRLAQYGPNALIEKEESFAAKRGGNWQAVQSSTLAPGDIVKIRLGVIMPANLRMVRSDYASIDQAVSEKPIRWEMPQVLGVCAVLGFFCVVQSFGPLLIGMRALTDGTCSGSLRGAAAGHAVVATSAPLRTNERKGG